MHARECKVKGHYQAWAALSPGKLLMLPWPKKDGWDPEPVWTPLAEKILSQPGIETQIFRRVTRSLLTTMTELPRQILKMGKKYWIQCYFLWRFRALLCKSLSFLKCKELQFTPWWNMIGLLGAFAKFQKATIIFAIYLFVRPSVLPHGTKSSHWTDFLKI